MNVNDLVRRVDELLSMGAQVLDTQRSSEGFGKFVDAGVMSGFRSATLSFIDRVYGPRHPHFSEVKEGANGARPSDAQKVIAILGAIRSEISGGWLFTLKGLITAEVFADFLEMAEHLLLAGYKDPAAVMCGSVLEEHMRQLCQKEGVPLTTEREDRDVPRKADALNSELAKVEVYSKLDQKQITAWLALRNNAAHGKYDEYTSEQVRNMLVGVTEFMVRVSV